MQALNFVASAAIYNEEDIIIGQGTSYSVPVRLSLLVSLLCDVRPRGRS